MKFLIGKNPQTDFKILSDDGEDLTRHFHVANLSLEIDAADHTLTTVKLEIFADIHRASGSRIEPPGGCSSA